MATNINASLDLLKSQATRVIIGNIKIRYPEIKKNLDAYIRSGGSDFRSLISLVNYNRDVLSSTTASSIYLLAYLDFYALYSVLYANYLVLDNLKEVSKNKYSYIYDIYKELESLISKKELLQKYTYSTYENFIFSKNVNQILSGYISRDSNVSKPLDTIDALKLPVRTSLTIDPAYITCVDVDNSISKTTSEFYKNELYYELLRLQNNKIGVASGNKATRMSAENGYREDPEVTGTIFGYFAKNIYVTTTRTVRSSTDELTEIYLSCSTNGIDWSPEYKVFSGIKSKIIIEDGIDTGLYITIKAGLSLRQGDRWSISIINANIAPPVLDIKIGFDTLNKITMIKFLDVSAYPLVKENSRIRRDKYGTGYVDQYIYDSRVGNIVSPQDRVYEYNVSFKQLESDVTSDEGKIALRYDFKIKDIQALAQTFWPHGSIVLNAEDVSQINTITIASEEWNPNYGIHTIEDPHVPRSLIEYNIIAETSTGRVVIPALPNNFIENNNSLYTWDFVIPKTIDENQGSTTYFGTAYYPPRFPVNQDVGLSKKAYKIFSGEGNPGLAYEPLTDIFVLTDYIYTQSHILWYPIMINNIEDTIDISLSSKWIKASANVYYLFYRDENNKIHTAIRNYNIVEDILLPFTGKVYGQIEMRSADQPHVTPLVFNYSISCV
jgi:hypothetical protein